MKTRILTVLAVIGSAATARAQTVPTDNTAFGTTAAEFLLLGAGARGAALGGTYAAMATDVTALYWNPGGLALLERSGMTVSTYEFLAGTRYSWVGLAFPMGQGSRAVGLQGGTFGFSDAPVYTLEAPEGDGTTYNVAESFIGATYSQNFSDRFSAGMTAKVISDKLGRTSGTAFAVDFGTNFHTQLGTRPIRASFTIQNLGTTLKHDGPGLDVNSTRLPPSNEPNIPQEPQPGRLRAKDFNLPTLFRVGLAFDVMKSAASRLTVSSEFNQPNNSQPSAGGGLEWSVMNLASTGFSATLRGGYASQPDNSFEVNAAEAGFATSVDSQKNMDGLAVGGGLEYRRRSFGISLDYAARNLGVLGWTNYFSASLSW